jgi:16S rRNA processing protein RimM
LTSDRLSVGRIVKAHGIKGEVSVDVYSEAPQRFAPGSKMRAGADLEVKVSSSRPHQGRMLVRFDGVSDRNAAEALRGVELTIAASDAAPLAEGAFYPHDLEGCEVFDVSGARLGVLARVEENPANDLWIVRDGAREVYVPAVRAFVVSVEVGARRITLDPPPGTF